MVSAVSDRTIYHCERRLLSHNSKSFHPRQSFVVPDRRRWVSVQPRQREARVRRRRGWTEAWRISENEGIEELQ